MRITRSISAGLLALSLVACGGGSNSPRAVPAPAATNNNGSPVTGVITARFDPGAGVLPFPSNLLLSGTTDLTLNPPVANPNNFADPAVALSALDGFSTVAPWSMSWSVRPNPATLVAGQSVRLFEVTLTGPGGGVTGVVRELAPQEFVVALSPTDTTGRTLAIVPTVPLKQVTSYMAVITNGVTDANGNDATPDQTYFLAKRTTPVCNGAQVLDPLIPPTSCPSLEGLRQLVNSQEAAAASRGIPRDRIVLSFVGTTQSITPVLQAVKSTVQPRAHQLAPTGLTTANVGLPLPPVADLWIGFIELPYYLEAPEAGNPQTNTRVLTGFWQANPGAYVPPFNGLGLNPTSTNLTFANPFPRVKSSQRVPVLVTVPNANSGRSKPAAGWPVVIFQHGIRGNRSQALPLAATLAAQGFVTVAIDLPLHGLPPSSPLAIGNSPFGAVARERTFDVDLLPNDGSPCPGGAPVCPDGQVDASGTHFVNLGSLLTSRDNLRQGEVDLLSLAATIPQFNLDGAAGADTDGSRIAFAGLSLGGIVGTPFLALSDTVSTGFLSVPGGGIARLLEGSQTFGPSIRAGLAAAGVQPGTPNFDQFLLITQTVIDSGDPINWGFVTATNRVLLHQVAGDTVVPNAVPGAPLSGTEPMIRVLGLAPITATTQNAAGIRGAVRFNAGDHGSLLNPAASMAVTAEMQGQAASFIASNGTAVLVQNTSVIQQ
ncbi:MAG: Ig-like domain-containing protein [Xanthomonadales bacterium]|nr:Ig-like domain-containing protein [Xanthomonadales bacterium]